MSGREPAEAAEVRLAEALRARAGGAAIRPMAGRPPPRSSPARGVLVPLLIVLLGSVLLGAGLAVFSLIAPGALPVIG